MRAATCRSRSHPPSRSSSARSRRWTASARAWTPSTTSRGSRNRTSRSSSTCGTGAFTNQHTRPPWPLVAVKGYGGLKVLTSTLSLRPCVVNALSPSGRQFSRSSSPGARRWAGGRSTSPTPCRAPARCVRYSTDVPAAGGGGASGRRERHGSTPSSLCPSLSLPALSHPSFLQVAYLEDTVSRMEQVYPEPYTPPHPLATPETSASLSDLTPHPARCPPRRRET